MTTEKTRIAPKRPRTGTISGAVIKAWEAKGGKLTWSQAFSAYLNEAGNVNRAGACTNLARLLKRFGHKQGEPCGRTPWILDPMAKAPITVGQWERCGSDWVRWMPGRVHYATIVRSDNMWEAWSSPEIRLVKTARASTDTTAMIDADNYARANAAELGFKLPKPPEPTSLPVVSAWQVRARAPGEWVRWLRPDCGEDGGYAASCSSPWRVGDPFTWSIWDVTAKKIVAARHVSTSTCTTREEAMEQADAAANDPKNLMKLGWKLPGTPFKRYVPPTVVDKIAPRTATDALNTWAKAVIMGLTPEQCIALRLALK